MSDTAARLLLTTISSEAAALEIARELVSRRLAACVNVVPSVTSVYRWDGEIQEDAELLLVIKTSRERAPEIEAAFAELHPYSTPECLTLAPEHVEPSYLAWLLGMTSDSNEGV